MTKAEDFKIYHDNKLKQNWNPYNVAAYAAWGVIGSDGLSLLFDDGSVFSDEEGTWTIATMRDTDTWLRDIVYWLDTNGLTAAASENPLVRKYPNIPINWDAIVKVFDKTLDDLTEIRAILATEDAGE